MDDRAKEIVAEWDRNNGICLLYDHQTDLEIRISAYGDEREREALDAELRQFESWLRDPLNKINQDDAVDEIARAVSNRRRSLIKIAPEKEYIRQL